MKFFTILVFVLPLAVLASAEDSTHEPAFATTVTEPTEAPASSQEETEETKESPRRQYLGQQLGGFGVPGYGRGFAGQQMGGFGGFQQAGFQQGGFGGYPMQQAGGFVQPGGYRGTVTHTQTQTSIYQASSYYSCGQRWYTNAGVVCPPTFFPPRQAAIITAPSNACGGVAVGGQFGYTGPAVGGLGVAGYGRPQAVVSSVSTMYQSSSYYYCGQRCYTSVGVICPQSFQPPPTAVIVAPPSTCGRPIPVAQPVVPAYGSAVNAFPSMYQASSYYYCGQRCYTVTGVLCPQSFAPPPTAVIVSAPANACGGVQAAYGGYAGAGYGGYMAGGQQFGGNFCENMSNNCFFCRIRWLPTTVRRKDSQEAVNYKIITEIIYSQKIVLLKIIDVYAFCSILPKKIIQNTFSKTEKEITKRHKLHQYGMFLPRYQHRPCHLHFLSTKDVLVSPRSDPTTTNCSHVSGRNL